MKSSIFFSILYMTLGVCLGVGFGPWALGQSPAPASSTDHTTLPAIGSSLFDKIFRKTSPSGEIVYDVPTSIPALMQRILRLEGSGDRVTYSLLPLTRSLQRPVDLSYDPFANPRLVATVHKATNPDINNKIFVGYLKPKDQLEVISYNEEAGRFEFQLVHDFSKNPKVYYANRVLCLTCHQGQSPIFFRIPWAETTFKDRLNFDSHNSLVRDMVMLRSGATDLVSEQSDQTLIEKLFGGFPGVNDAQKFEDAADEADHITLAQRFWIKGCGDSNACRLAMLLREIDSLKDHLALYKKYHDELLARLSNSPLQQESFFFPDITSYDLETVLRGQEGLGRFPVSFADAGPVDLAEAGLERPQFLLSLVNASSHLLGDQNPATKRRRDYMDVTYGFMEGRFDPPLGFFPFSLFEKLRPGSQITKEKVISQLISLYLSGNSIFSGQPFRVRTILYEVLKGMGDSRAQAFEASALEGPTPPKEIFKEPLPVFFSDPALNKFAKNCAICHGNPSVDFPPQFLVGSESQVLEQMTALRPALMFKLENNLMPPDPARRKTLQDSGDYQSLLEYVKQLSARP